MKEYAFHVDSATQTTNVLSYVNEWGHILQVQKEGRKPFRYSSGNFGPIFLDLERIVGSDIAMRGLIRPLAFKLLNDIGSDFDIVVGIATGGIAPGIELKNCLNDANTGKRFYFVYERGNKLIGIESPEIKGRKCIIFDDVGNFHSNSIRVSQLLRTLDFDPVHVAVIVEYSAKRRALLKPYGMNLTSLIEMNVVLDVLRSNGEYSEKEIDSCKEFLGDPYKWMWEHHKLESVSSMLKRGFRRA